MAMGACVGTALLTSGTPAFAQAETGNTVRMERLEKENAELKKRLDSLEGVVQKEGLTPNAPPYLVKALSEIQLSGFVQASYFYNAAKPDDRVSDAYLWNSQNESFSLNKFKLTVASKPVASDKWDAGFKASLIFGEDAPQLNTPGNNSSFNDLREAYVELNVPIGTGLNIKAGELISLLNYESGDGGAANVNFSQGNQWWFTGNGPSAGVQATYNFTDKVGLTARVDNGLFQGPVDNNEGKAFSASLNVKPCSNFWFNIYPFYDVQPAGVVTKGVGTIGGVQITEKLGTGYEVDYFNFDAPGNSSDLWSIGGWVWYDFTSKVGLAFRADYISSPDGVLGPAVRPGAGIVTTDTDGDLASFTLTLNWKPAPNIKIQPEIRWDTTSYKNGLDGHKSRFIAGAGVSYLF
ncbi:MAG TPA: outer membrane beta-barrel protein [Candidatus Limnocylindria bacterium]|nr:outer membrane beta-barrel protein [Candidatus Limnocylindria bacterium]